MSRIDQSSFPLTPHAYSRKALKNVFRGKDNSQTGEIVYSRSVKPSMSAWQRFRVSSKDYGREVQGGRVDHAREIGTKLNKRSINLVDQDSSETLVPRQRKIIAGKDFDKLHQKAKRRNDRFERDLGNFVLASEVADLANQDPELLADFKNDLRSRLDEMLVHGHIKRQGAFGAPLAYVGFEPGAFFHGATLFTSNETEQGHFTISGMNPSSAKTNTRTAPQLARLLARNLEMDNLSSREMNREARKIVNMIANIIMGAIDMTKDFSKPRNSVDREIQDGFVMRNVLKFTEFLVMVKNNLSRRQSQALKAKAFALLDMLDTKSLPKSDLLKRKLLVALKYDDLTSKQAQKLMTKGKALTEGQLGVDAQRARAELQSDQDISLYAHDPLVNPSHVDSQAYKIRPEYLGTDDGMKSMGLSLSNVQRARTSLEQRYQDSDLARLIARSRNFGATAV